MNLIIDIGGTHFRISCNYSYYNKVKHSISCQKDLFDLICNEVKLRTELYEIDKIIIALPGIVKNFRLYECNNLSFLNFIDLPSTILNKECIYINDGDLAIIGELKYNNISKSLTVLNLIIGTGVGSSIWCNNNILFNSEVVSIFETYLGGKVFDTNKIVEIKKRFINDLSCIVELLNVDTIILNGFIKKYDDLIIDKNQLNIRSFYKRKLKIIYSECEEPVLYGGFVYNDYINS